MTPTSAPSRTARSAWLVAALCALLMIATEPGLSIVWDEGYTLGRQNRLRLWLKALADPRAFARDWRPPTLELVRPEGAPPPRPSQIDTRAKLLLDPQVLAWFWPFAREEPHGHPPFYAIVGLVGDVLTPWRADLPRARLGPILVFSLMAGALFGFVARRWGTWPGMVAAGAWMLQPNLFGHGHYATYDAILSATWLGSVLAFTRAVERMETDPRSRWPRWRWVLVFGLLLGCAADTKLTGWLLPIPLLAWAVLTRSRRAGITLLAGGLIALVFLYVMNPPWWTEPIVGVARFLASNLGRGETIRIKTLFLGQVYSTPDGSLPWYNTLLWTLMVTPVGFLALALLGIGRSLRRWKSEPFGLLVLLNWGFLLALRALPRTPGHDGVRQFLPAFGMLCLAAGLGCASLVALRPRLARLAGIAAVGEGLISVMVMWPVPLSYFSPVVGGLPGATRMGMEPTYYWDALTSDTLAWLRAHSSADEKVSFATFPTSWLYLRDVGALPHVLVPGDSGFWAWYVVQNRPGPFSPLDRALVAGARPAFTVEKLGVPLLWIFPKAEVRARLRPTRSLRNTTPAPPRAGRTGNAGERVSSAGSISDGSLTRGVDLARGMDRGGRPDDRGRGGRPDDRGSARGRGGRLVAELQAAPFGVAAATPVEQAALLGSRLAHGRRARRRGAWLADRGRWRAGRRRARFADHDRGADRGRVRAALLVAGLSVGRQHGAEHAREGQDHQMSSHGVYSTCPSEARRDA